MPRTTACSSGTCGTFRMSLAPTFEQELKVKPTPTKQIIQDVAKLPEQYPYAPENFVVNRCNPSVAYNPAYIAPSSNRPLVEPEASPFWTDPTCTCTDLPPYAVIGPDDKLVAGLLSQTPGKLWHYMTGRLKTTSLPSAVAFLMTSPTSKLIILEWFDQTISAPAWSCLSQ